MPRAAPRTPLLHAFLADTLQANGIAAIKGGLELCGPGIALTGSAAAIDKAEELFGAHPRVADPQLSHSVELAGPWSVSSRSGYRYSPEKDRWVAAAS